MLREIGDAMLARGYAFDLLYRNLPPHSPQFRDARTPMVLRPKRRYLRRALAWSFDRSGRLLTGAAARIRPAGETPTLQGCG